ncbi:unnamed protein product [Ranitomeya imitator]|uniref:Macoilin n=1 Tax=Ranitomeya imitator TaxID=111125 RepID=A0ABN9L5W2_9NEOB|nr:unnamed protein product [Ranitomeya imitator]
MISPPITSGCLRRCHANDSVSDTVFSDPPIQENGDQCELTLRPVSDVQIIPVPELSVCSRGTSVRHSCGSRVPTGYHTDRAGDSATPLYLWLFPFGTEKRLVHGDVWKCFMSCQQVLQSKPWCLNVPGNGLYLWIELVLGNSNCCFLPCSTFLYLKFLVVWALVLLADFVLEFRFEYLWPFWLFIRSVYDSFRYQGLAFSVFFVCVAFTSDIICLLFIPVQWLFFAASTYVWVQYVWHTERGVCLPTVSLWILFVYIEAAIRFKDLKNFHVDLCRPFAAHCIGYPVVTLGFGFKSYVSYKMRLRKQKEVQKENEFYMQLLQQALPPEQQMLQRQEREAEEAAAKGLSEMDSPILLQHNGLSSNKKISSTLPELEYKEKGKEKDVKRHNLGINNNILQPTDSKVQEIEYMENHINSKRLNNDLGSTENLLKEDMCTASSKNYKNTTGTANSSPRSHSSSNGTIPSSTSSKNDKKKCTSKSPSMHKDPTENCIPNNQLSKPDTLVR